MLAKTIITICVFEDLGMNFEITSVSLHLFKILRAMGINLIKSEPISPKNNQPALVFIHGAWHGAWCWQEYFIPYFTNNGYECYTFDLPCHGAEKDEKGINKFRIKNYVSYLELVLKQINKRVILVGHSMGGYIVQKYLEQNDCEAAILITPVPGKPLWPLFFKLFSKQPWTMVKLITTFDLFQLVNTTDKASHLLFANSLSLDQKIAYTKKLGGESFRVMVFDFLLSKIKRRKNLIIPMLVQGAGKDNVVSVKETKYTRRFQQADYQFFKYMSHDVMLDPNWELAAIGILNWLRDKFPEPNQSKESTINNPTLKIQFPDAIQDLIANLGENNEMDTSDTKTLGGNGKKIKRDN